MVGAGVFAAVGPAARVAGSGLLIGLVIAGFVAYCNATSSAELAAVHPSSGGTYVYGRERLGPFWGFLAGWGFVIGKTASCAAMALTIGAYLWPDYARPVGIVAVVALTAVNLRGVTKTALAAKVFLAITAAVLVFGAVVGAGEVSAPLDFGTPTGGVYGVLGAAGLMFFA